jgi:NAD(P)-dependent dehydrogenase (short-subunit alcohol dehydrogenase family)
VPREEKGKRIFTMKRLEGKVAVVTGGNSGIGLASAKRLQDEGARVAISGRSQKTLDEAKASLGSGLLAVQSDVSRLADIDKLFAEVAKKFDKIDVLFVNAGVAKFAPFTATTEALYDEQFDINVKGAYSKSASASKRRGIHHSEHQRRGNTRRAKRQCLFVDQGCDALLGANHGQRTRGQKHSGELRGSWTHRDADFWTYWAAARSHRWVRQRNRR